MVDFLIKLFPADFTGQVLWDRLIALACCLIAVALVYFSRKRRDLPFRWMFILFGIFLFAIGLTHLTAVWTPIKAITSALSLAAAASLVVLIPRALRLTGPDQLRAANEKLESELGERRRKQEALQQASGELEVRLHRRTAELARSREHLQAEIAERRSVEDALRKQANLLDLAPDAIIVRDMTGAISYWNAGAEQIYGWKREEAVGNLTRQLLQSVYPPEIENLKTELIRDGRWDGELIRTQRDGGTVVVASRWALQRDPAGEPIAMLEINTDITEQKRAEAALRESEERFRYMADTAPVMMWVAGPDKRCTFFNKTWLAFTGRTMEQELAQGWAEGVHPEDRERTSSAFDSAFDARRNFAIEYRFRRVDGEYRWVLSSGVPRFAPDGVFAGYIGSDIDITDLRRAQEETFERQKLESLGVLTGGIAHDFNNLLGGVLAHAELALAELAEGSDPDEQLHRIRDGAIRGAEIVRQLMIYAGQESAVFELVDVSRVVEEMVELLKVSVSKHATLKTSLGKGLPPVRANPAQIRQVVMNLVTNASEAIGDQAGVISVTSSLVDSARDLPEGEYLYLEISDTGIGMTQETQARIFEPFFTTKFAGRGLGLAVVQGIVRGLGGAIYLKSEPGRGTMFQILLPCASETARASREIITPVAPDKISPSAGLILIIEDENPLRMAVSKMLRKRGFSVVEAGDGFAALNLLRAHQDELSAVLLDFTLPGISSQEIFQETVRLRPDIRLVVTSAYSEERVAASFGALRVARFVRKPYRLGDLVDLLVEGAISARPS